VNKSMHNQHKKHNTGFVTLVRITMNGDLVIKDMPAHIASLLAIHSPDNGVIYRSARIIFRDVLDEFGQSG